MASIGTWPSAIKVRECRLVLRTNQIVTGSLARGTEQAVDRMNDRWAMSLKLPARTRDEAARVEAFLASFRGQVNWVYAWHFGRPSVRGTLSGAPVLQAVSPQGDSQLKITAPQGQTVLAGDVLGVSGQLVMVSSNATANASNLLTVNLVNRLRVAAAAGGAVIYDKPTAPFRLISHGGVNHVPGYAEEVDVELLEAVL